MDLSDLLEIGTIVAPQGLKGELRVNPSTDFPERFEQAGQRWLQSESMSQPQPVKLLSGYQVSGKNIFIIKLAEVKNRNQAEALRGAKLLVLKSDRPQLNEDEYHVSDLLDLQVYNQQTGENIGVITNVFSTAHDILEVRLHQEISQVTKPVTVLIPFVKEIVPVVDLTKKVVEINPPAGLLDINR